MKQRLLESFSIECRKTKTKATTTANHQKISQGAHENSKWKLANRLKHGKTQVTKSRLVLVWIWLVKEVARVAGPIM